MKVFLIQFLLSIIALIMINGCSAGGSSTDTFQNISKNSGALYKSSGIRTYETSIDDTINYKSFIKAGDQLQIMVWGYPEFNTTSTVKDYGTVTIPLVGEVMAAGLSTDRFTNEVAKRLTEYIKGEPNVTISHIEMNKRISVMGAVSKQDNYPALADVSLVEIIAAAGGPEPNADLRHIKIFRNGGKTRDVIEVDLEWHLETGDLENIPKVKSGDTVFVPVEENLMRELSDFVRDALILFGFFTLLR